mgnify:CR=1 FL=1
MEKKLKPSFRENKRYLIVSAGKEKVEKAILDFIGILGYSKAGISWINENVLAVNRESLNNIKASLAFAGIKINKISGTLKGLEK